MLYDNRIAAAFLEGRPAAQEAYFYLLQEYKEPDIKRRDIVRELDSRYSIPSCLKLFFQITGSS